MVGVEFKELPLGKLAMNTGQLEGVPANPRQWTQADVDKLARSISETPELLQARGAIVVPHGKRYVVLGGNMRVTAAKALGLEAVPCAVLPEGTPAEKLREIVIKDNSSFGAWDMDALANEWDDLPLTDWGVPAWDAQDTDNGSEEGNGTPKERADLSDQLDYNYRLEITLENEADQEKLYNELTARGYQCRVLTL